MNYLYDRRPFVTKKKKWSFHCLNCEKKFSSDENDYYYVWDYPMFGDPISHYHHLLLCSKKCVDEMHEKVNSKQK